MSIIGLILLIYGWFALDNFGFSADGIISVVLGILLMAHSELTYYFLRRRYDKKHKRH